MRITDVSKLRGPLKELNDQLFGDNDEERLESLKLWLKKVSVLKFERKVSVASRRFVAAESFTRSNAKVCFGYIDGQLLKLFGKVQENVLAGELAVHTLRLHASHDPEILVALGPQSRRFIKLGQFYQMIEAQGYGQEGPLLIDGRANIAYVVDDENDAPWAVSAKQYQYPRDGGWRVVVCSVASLNGWCVGDRVLSQVA